MKVNFLSKTLLGRKEGAFGFGRFISRTYVHFEVKLCKVLVNEVQASCELIAVIKIERAVVYVKYT